MVHLMLLFGKPNQKSLHLRMTWK